MERTKYIQTQEIYALELFSSDAFLTINKQLLKHYGPEVSIFLSNLVDKYKYYKDRDHLKDGDWFYITHENQIEQTGLTLTKLRACKTILKNDNILEVRLKGIPAKEWYKLNFKELLDIIPISAIRHGIERQSVMESDGLSSGLLYNPSYIRKTIPPPLNLVIKYCQERKNSVDPNTFHDFYTTKNWMVGIDIVLQEKYTFHKVFI